MPVAAASPSTDVAEFVVLHITAENQILHDGKVITLLDVEGRVRAGLREADTPVVVRADEKSDHGVFVSVWDAARRGGAEQLSFSTTN